MDKDNIFEFKKSIDSLYFEIDSLKFDIYRKRLEGLKLDVFKEEFNFDSALKVIIRLRNRIEKLKTDVEYKNDEYEKYSKEKINVIANEKSLFTEDSTIKKSYTSIIITVTNAMNSMSSDKAHELLASLVFMQNNEIDYKSLPIQFNSEQTELNISIVPRDEKFNLQSYNTQIIFPQKIKNYNVIGISFYGSTLVDEEYSSIKTPLPDSTFNYNFVKEEVNKAELGIAVLLRHGRKWNKENNFGGHFSLGTGISVTNKVKPRFLLGGGLSAGKRHMLAVDIGAIAGYVNRLSKVISLEQTYNDKPEIITISSLKIGFFGSIGYIFHF